MPLQIEHANAPRLRQHWFYKQRAYPHKHIPPGARLKALEELRKMEAAQRSESSRLKQQTDSAISTAPATSSTTQATTLSSTSWTLIGPQPTTTPFAFNPVSGRVTALVVDPSNPNVVYLGGAEGGVWKTTDGGQTWIPLTDNQPSLAVGSIALDPENPQTIYVGTGEENFNGDAYFGAGILKSTDGGATWTSVGTGPEDGPCGPKPYFYCGYVGSLAVDPQNSQVVLAAVSEVSNLGGVWRSADGGQTWTQIGIGLPTQVFFNPTNGNVAYAAIAGGGVYKSTNAGLNWAADNGTGTNVLATTNSFRISVAIDPRNTSTLYASVTSLLDSSGNSTVLGFYKTADGGANWTAIWTAATSAGSTFPSTYCASQCWYDSVLAVDPASSSIFVGGSAEAFQSSIAGALWRSEDGGSTWSDVDPPPTTTGVQALHPDLHAIAFAADGSKMYVGTDGGVWNTTNVTTTPVIWTNLNSPLALTQFYPGISVASYNSNFTLGGTQDNGVQEYNGSLAWQMLGCGDGAQTAIDPTGSGVVYAGCVYVPGPDNRYFLFKFTPDSGWAPADTGINGADPASFVPPLALDRSNPQTLYFGTDNIYQSTNGGQSWSVVTGPLYYPSFVTAIAVAPSDSNTVYAGTNESDVYGTSNAEAGTGATWSLRNDTLGYITSLAVDPQQPTTVYAGVSGFWGGHVFVSTDGASQWTDISGDLPDIPVNDIAIDPDISNTIYVATDIGVFEGTNAGSGWQWTPLGTGLPSVVIMSLKLQHATRILRAASHGRSAWDIQLPTPTGPTAVFSVPGLTFAPQQVGTTSAAQNVIVTNNGSATLSITSIAASGDFAETNTCSSSLNSGSNCSISVTFTPTTFGSRTGAVTLTDNAASGSSQTIGLHGSAFSGAVSLSPTNLSFGNQLVGTTSTAQTVTLTNSSTAPLTIVSIASPSLFAAATDCPLQPGTLPGGASCHINVTFSPTAMGQVAEQVTITDSATSSPRFIVVDGNGIAPVISLSPMSLTFNNQEVGTSSSAQTINLTNTGMADLSISAITINDYQTPAGFSETDDCPRSPSTIPPQGNCTINVTFSPRNWYENGNYGTDSGTGVISANAFPGPGYFQVYGTDYSGAGTASPTSLSFGHVDVGQSSPPQTVTLTSSGSLPLYITAINPPIGITESDNCPRLSTSPQGLAPGATCAVQVTYAPTSTGSLNGESVTIWDSSLERSDLVSVSGDSLKPDFALGVASGSSSTATVAPGNMANYPLTLTPQGGFSQAVAVTCTGAPSLAICTVSPSSVMMDGTNVQSVKVTVTTAAPGLVPPGSNGGPPAPGGFAFAIYDWWLVLLLMASLVLAFRRRGRASLVAGAVLLAAITLSCGGGGGGGAGTSPSPGTPAGTYTLTVTGSSGSLTHQIKLSLTVQ